MDRYPPDGGSFQLAHISRCGRPGLRLAIWRAVWPMLQYNPVMAAKYAAAARARRANGSSRSSLEPRRPQYIFGQIPQQLLSGDADTVIPVVTP